MRFNEYRIMWVVVFFDMPTDTADDRKQYRLFRKRIMTYGFGMFQYSIYIRHCLSKEIADVHTKRIQGILPEKGHVVIFSLTDKQFGDMKVYYGAKSKPPPNGGTQLEMF